MKYVKFGKSNPKAMRFCHGAMGFGSRNWRRWVMEEADAAPVIARALDHGINFSSRCRHRGLRPAPDTGESGHQGVEL